MFDPGDDAACLACTFWMDSVGDVTHIQRMGWTLPWYSSHGSMFNYDFHAPWTRRSRRWCRTTELRRTRPRGSRRGGIHGSDSGASAFLRRDDRVFHTYSCYGRGIDLLNASYNWLDLTARGRQEDWEQPPGRSDASAMGWLRRKDEYDPGRDPRRWHLRTRSSKKGRSPSCRTRTSALPCRYPPR